MMSFKSNLWSSLVSLVKFNESKLHLKFIKTTSELAWAWCFQIQDVVCRTKITQANKLYDHFASLVSHFVLSVLLYVFTVPCTDNLSMSISASSPEMKNLCKVPDYCEFRLSGNQTTNSKHCIRYQNVSIILLNNLNSLLT